MTHSCWTGTQGGAVRLHVLYRLCQLICAAVMPAGTVCSIASSASCSHIAAVTQQQHSTASLFIWQSHTANSAWQYTQEATILLPDSPTAVAWLPKIGISPTLAVACASKLTVFCKSHIGSWAPIANLSHLAQPLSDLQMSQAGLPVITAGTQIGVLSHTVQTQPAAAAADGLPLVQVPLAHLALEVGGPLPDYAPAALALLIARGRLQAAGQVIRSVLTWLRLHAAHQDIALSPPATSKSPLDNQLLPDTALELLVDSKFMTDIANVVSALPLSEDASTRDSIQADAKNAQGSSTGSSQHAAGTVGLLDNTAHPAAPSLVPAELSAAEDEHLASYSQHAKPAASVLADPYAFNATAFDVQQDDTETEQEPLQQPQPAGKAPDPYAFDMGAFGMDQGDTELPEEQSLPEELHQQQSTAKKLAGDPFAFDAEAFGFDDAQSQQQPTESISGLSDPYAFDAGAFGASNDGVQQQEHPETSAVQPSSASAADPSAFNPGAFGISGEEQPPTDEQQPQLATPQTGSAAADPFAFNPDAFGLGSSAMYAEAPEQDSQDNMPQVVPAEPSQQPGGGDPFAFDAGAFGMDPDPAPNPDAQQQRKPAMPAPYANASRNDDADNGPMRKHTSAVLPQVAANSGAANRQVPDSQPTPASQQKQARPQIHRPKAVTGNQLQPTPLTSEEIQELHQLLQKVLLTSSQAVEQPQSPSSPLSNADALGSSGSVAAAVLPPGLTFQDSVTLLNMANMLCKEPQTSLPQNRQEAEPNVALLLDMTPVDWPALDAAAQKMVRNVQLAVYSHHSLTGKQTPLTFN